MKQFRWVSVAAVTFFFLAGCTSMPGVSPYRTVDLDADVDAATLDRYRAEFEGARAAGQRGDSIVLERTNWWPLGLLAYWRKGDVRAMTMPGGKRRYMVSASEGFGPLSVFYVTERSASYDAQGRRVAGSRGTSLLWGHLAMSHHMERWDEQVGHWGRMHSVHFAHHLINWGAGHGGSWFSLFSAPNPVGVGQ
jgi:hypothetical protein